MVPTPLLLYLFYCQAGVRHYIAEIDAGEAWLFNKYLETGDEQFLQPVFNYWIEEGAQWGNKDFYKKLEKIYAWNRSLPSGQKITFVGIDGIQGVPVNVQYLRYLLKGRIHPERQWPLMDHLINLLSADSLVLDTCRESTPLLISDMDKHATYYRKKLGDHYFYVRHLLVAAFKLWLNT